MQHEHAVESLKRLYRVLSSGRKYNIVIDNETQPGWIDYTD